MYKDLEQMRRMIRMARQEKYPMTEEHLQELERYLRDADELAKQMEEEWEWPYTTFD